MSSALRSSAALLAALLAVGACKNGGKPHKSSDADANPPPGAPALKDAPYLVHVKIALEGVAPVTSLEDVQGTFVNSCLSCHGAGSVLDLSHYPFKGRFATPEATVTEIIARMKSYALPMPPLPGSRVPAADLAKIEAWLADGLLLKPPPRATPVFAQGLVLKVRYRVTGQVDWLDSSLPWNGSGDFPGFFRQLAPGQTVDVVIVAAAEDGTELASQSMHALSIPPQGNLEFSVTVEEARLKAHATDHDAAIPGKDGALGAANVGETSLELRFAPAVDVLTPDAGLTYAAYVGEAPFDSAEAAMKTGRLISDFAAYAPTLKVSGLAAGKTYYFVVVVKDKGGNLGVYKMLEQATVADQQPPKPPTPARVTVSALSDVGVTLSWKAASDNFTAKEHLAYQVYFAFQNATGDPASERVEGRTSVTLQGLVPETTYYFDVLVQDEAGNQAWYDRVQVRSRAGSGAIDILAYGRQCADRLGELRPFNCLDGALIPIVVNGEEIPSGLTAIQAQNYVWGTGNRQLACDKPALLGLGDQGRCIPYSRVGRLKSYRKDGSEHPDVDTMFTCRRYQTRLGPQQYNGRMVDGADVPLFEDIAVIQHNRVSGETCWFQMLRPNYASEDGARVPPPTEAVTAPAFWLSPQATADKKCFRCHDADPWMHSPYIDQVRDADGHPIVPPGGFGGGRSGKYSMLGSRAFHKWDKAVAVTSTATDTNGKSCTSCHNVGNFNGCQTWAKQASGQLLAPNLSTTGQTFALKFWMPPAADGIHSLADWQSSGYQKAAERLAACCANPAAAGCAQRPIMTAPPPHE